VSCAFSKAAQLPYWCHEDYFERTRQTPERAAEENAKTIKIKI
jgi:hypothetical protein